jgi:signal transduction histidine kinase
MAIPFVELWDAARAFAMRRLPALAGGLTLAAALAVRATEPVWVERLRLTAFDLMVLLEPRRPDPASPVRIVLVDEESLARIGPWPWPRTVHAELLDRLSAAGARTVALDFVFPQPDRTSPARLIERLPQTPEVKRLAAASGGMPDHDRIFAAALRRGPAALGYAFGSDAGAPPPTAGFGVSGPDPTGFLADMGGATTSIAPLAAAASGAGSFSVFPEPDGVVRRVPLLFASGGTLYPSLALEALRLYVRQTSYHVQSASGGRPAVEWVRVGPHVIPTDAVGRAWVHYPAAFESVPAWEVLSGGAGVDTFRDALVFVGASAVLLKDNVATPLGPATPGVAAHAVLAAQTLEGRSVVRPDWASGFETVYMLALGGALVLLLPRLGAAACAGLGLAAAAVVFPLSWAIFRRLGWLLDPLTPSAAVGAVYAAVSAAAYWLSEGERRRLQVLDSVKDELIATVSHDLRGPVNAMLMISDAMKMGLYGPVTEKQVRNLDLMKAAGHKLTQFVTNILDAAKIKAGRMELHRQTLKAEEVLPPVAELFSLSAKAKEVTLDQRLEASLPAVSADREKIEQVLNNLLGNALKFTPAGGRIILSAWKEGEAVVFAVTDTGYGISAQDLSKLFRKFSQVDLARQRDAGNKGTGLGLSICREVIEAHGGRIWAESELGKGSSFRFSLRAVV